MNALYRYCASKVPLCACAFATDLSNSQLISPRQRKCLQMSSSKITCFLCASFAGSSFSDVVRHIGYVHAFEPNFLVTCGLHGCKRQYKSFGAYRVHLYKVHGSVMKDGLASEDPSLSPSYPPTSTSSLDDMDFVGKNLVLKYAIMNCIAYECALICTT